MKYLLLIYGNEAAMEAATKADTERMHGAYGAYAGAMVKAGSSPAASAYGHRRRPPRCASRTARPAC
jgi:hypothetical protein